MYAILHTIADGIITFSENGMIEEFAATQNAFSAIPRRGDRTKHQHIDAGVCSVAARRLLLRASKDTSDSEREIEGRHKDAAPFRWSWR